MFRPTTRVAVLQVAILLVAAALAWLAWGENAAMSAAYGVAVALIVTLLMLLRERESGAHPEWSAQRQLGQFFRLEVERLLLAGSLLALGFLTGNAVPAALITGFALGQLGWVAALMKQ